MKKLFSRSGLIVLMIVIVGSLGVSYAGYTAMLETKVDLTTGSMDFEFCDSDELFSIQIQNGKDEKPVKLKADISYGDKTLMISNIQAIDVSLLEGGNLRFIIQYGLKPTDDSSILKAIIREEIGGYEDVSLMRNNTTGQWVIRGGPDDQGYKGKAAGTVPEGIDKLIPDSLGDFHVTESFIVAKNEEYMEGTIILDQAEVPDWILSGPIPLSQLGLSDQTIEEIIHEEDLSISLYGFYSFEIPLDLNQFNGE